MRTRTLRQALTALVLIAALAVPSLASAQAYSNYPDVDWLTLETEHFRIYYYPEVEWTARMTAKYAEAAYPKVTALFDFPLKEKLAIMIRDQEDYSNGYAAFLIDKIAMWAKPLYYILRGRQEWISDCFAHEFGHMVSLKANDWKAVPSLMIGSGLIEDGVHNADYGISFTFGFTLPFWWIEGIAEYSDHMSGFNWWTTSRDMHLRMAILEETFLTYDEASNAYFQSRFDGEKGYQQGYSMGLYVQENFGAEKYAQLALNNSRNGYGQWDKNLDDVLGVDGPTLFDGYIKWMRDRYNRQIEPIKKAEHVGRKLFTTSREEEADIVERAPDGRTKVELGRRYYEDPVPEDDAEKKKLEEARKKEKPKYVWLDRRQRRAKFGPRPGFNLWPKASPDGKLTAYASEMGVTIYPLPVEEWPVFTGRYLAAKRNEKIAEDTKMIPGSSPTFEGGFDWSPDSNKILYPGFCGNEYLPCVELDGYQRMDLYEYELETEDITRLTKKLRVELASYSPDGGRIAFVHFFDGQNWLGVMPANAREVTKDGKCEIDGEPREGCITWLIKKHDGTLLGQPSWSPDGQKIVIDLYRNNQQDVWWLNADGSGLEPLTWDRAEDRDGKFAPDGKSILYTSDRTGVFNVYQMDLATREVKQLTNVLGGAYHPFLTPNGNLLYAYFTSLRFDIHGLKKENFYNQVVDAGYDFTPEEVARNLAYHEALPEIRDKSVSYNPFAPSNWAPPIGLPLLIYEGRGLQLGVAGFMSDMLDKHTLLAQVLLGQSTYYYIGYENAMWYPTIGLVYLHADINYDFAQGMGANYLESNNYGDPEFHFEAPLTYKNRQSYDLAALYIDFPITNTLQLSLNYDYRYITGQGRSADKAQAYLTNNSYKVTLEYSNALPSYYGLINPRGRSLTLEYVFTRTGLPTKSFADVEWIGRINPPGDHSDDYNYHELQLGYTESIPVTWWNRDGGHTLEFHFRGGWQNRNVDRFDEFFAGSLHPMRWVPTQSTTHEFAGYEDFSLGGETMLIFSLMYRFPIYKEMGLKMGPFFFTDLYCELFGTAGNLWGFTGDMVTDAYGNVQRDDASYWDPKVKRGTVRRERPFVDIASKNGNYMLYDIGMTLKLKGYFTNDNIWNSFVRLSYGLNEIAGRYEVNDDRVYVDNFPNDPRYSEIEPKSFRISIGLGSSF